MRRSIPIKALQEEIEACVATARDPEARLYSDNDEFYDGYICAMNWLQWWIEHISF